MMLVGAVVSYYVMEIINFEVVTWNLWRILINALPFYVLGRLICLITRNVRIGLGVMLILSFLIALVMHYVWVFRGQPILPWDLKSIKTAATVEGYYSLLNDIYEKNPVVSRTGVYDREDNWSSINEFVTDDFIL